MRYYYPQPLYTSFTSRLAALHCLNTCWKPAVPSWHAVVCQHWLMPAHSQLCELCVHHSCRAGLSPMRQMIPHYHTQHSSSFSTPLPLLSYLVICFHGPHCKATLYFQSVKNRHFESLKCSPKLKTLLFFFFFGLCVLKGQGQLPPSLDVEELCLNANMQTPT